VNPRPPDPAAVSDQEWADYLYMRRNELGVQTEWWYHRAGCGQWFLAERHTLTNEVVRTWVWQAASPHPQPLPRGQEKATRAGGGSPREDSKHGG